MTNELYEIGLHESLHPAGRDMEITRVPGGWIYTTYSYVGGDGEHRLSSVFVPFHSEFQNDDQ